MKRNLLPAYVVFKVLANETTSIKEVLLAFITSFIKNEYKTNTFLINNFAPKFNEYYGFKIPTTVIKSVLSENQKIQLSRGGWYKLDEGLIDESKTYDLDDYKPEIELLLNDFLSYANKLGTFDKEKLLSSFLAYFSDSINQENNCNNNTLISRYIIEIQQTNSQLKKLIDNLNYGSIIYNGITMDLTEIQSWDKKLVIYLNTDILFDIFGLNGTCYQESALEFLSLVHEVNQKTEWIQLKYLNLTKKEIHRFFYAAGKVFISKNQLSQSEGMDNLLSRCKEYADFAEQEGLFFAELKKHNINYDNENKIEIMNEAIFDEDQKDSYIDKNFTFFDFTDDYLNFIEELRNGYVTKKLSEAKYIFLTRTDRILSKSKEKNNITEGVRLAPSIEYVITSLWFKLNKGFGISKIQSLDIVLKSKKIYAGIVADEKMKKIQEAQNAFNVQKLSPEQAYEIIASFKRIPSKPEDISLESVETFNGLNNKTLNQVLESKEIERQKNNEIIEKLANKSTKQELELTKKDKLIYDSTCKVESLENQLLQNKDDIELGKKVRKIINVIKCIGKIILWILLHVGIPVIFVLLLALFLKFINKEEKIDIAFILSNWISLSCTFCFTELLTWIKTIVNFLKKK